MNGNEWSMKQHRINIDKIPYMVRLLLRNMDFHWDGTPYDIKKTIETGEVYETIGGHKVQILTTLVSIGDFPILGRDIETGDLKLYSSRGSFQWEADDPYTLKIYNGKVLPIVATEII